MCAHGSGGGIKMPQDSSAQTPLSFISHTFTPSHTLSDPAASPSHTHTHTVCKASVYELDTGQAVQYEWIDTMHANTFPDSRVQGDMKS